MLQQGTSHNNHPKKNMPASTITDTPVTPVPMAQPLIRESIGAQFGTFATHTSSWVYIPCMKAAELPERMRSHPETVLMDVREHPTHQQVRGAVRYDPRQLTADVDLALPIAHDETIVLYGDSHAAVERVAAMLRANHYVDVEHVEGPFSEIARTGIALEELTQEQIVPRTV
jgi:rhodanese-related sulfurtransferase